MILHWTAGPAPRHIRVMSGLLALLFAWLIGAPLSASIVEDVAVREGRIVVSLSEAPGAARAFVLTGPSRIAVDIDRARPGAARIAAAGPVAALRQGSRPGGGTRLVFDLSRAAVVTSGSFSADGRTLTLALRDVAADRFAQAAARAAVTIAAPPAGRYAVTIPVPPPARRLGLPRVTGGDDSRPLVVIDAGHGGHDPGALSPHDGTREKDVTLAIARAIRDRLEETGRVRVALTRDGDRYLVHRERFELARRLGADLFISIHADAAPNGEARGASVYTLSEIASDREAARLAARENKTDILGGVNLGGQPGDVSSILIDLTQRETLNASAQFARLLGREGAQHFTLRPSFHRMASLMVLKAPDMPSVLFETGYISNDADGRFISSRAGQQAIARGVASAIDVFFARRLAAR